MRTLILAAIMAVLVLDRGAIAQSKTLDIMDMPALMATELRPKDGHAQGFPESIHNLVIHAKDALGIIWIGYPWYVPSAEKDQSGLVARVVFAAKELSDFEILKSIADTSDIRIVSSVRNEESYLGYLVTIINKDGRYYDCGKTFKKRMFPTWQQGYHELLQEADKASKLSYSDRLKWLQENIDCKFDPKKISKAELELEITTKEDCPATIVSLETCIIARGLVKTPLLLEGQ